MSRAALAHRRAANRLRRAAAIAAIGASGLASLAASPGSAWAETVRVGGTGAALGTLRILGDELTRRQPGLRVEVLPYIGSTGAIKGVDSGAIDLGLSGRPARPAEERLDVRLARYAMTPLVIAAHPDHATTGLARHELAAIYGGRQTHWPAGSPIRIILRPAAETDNDVLRTMSPELAAALDLALGRKGMRYAATDQDAADALEQTPGALGTSTLSLLISEKRRLAVLAIDGVAPSVDALRSGQYPFAKPLYLVTRATPSPGVKALVELIHSAKGQETLIQNGQLPARN